jgi:hypothetical protein
MQSCPGAQSYWLLHAGFASAGERQTPSVAQVFKRLSCSAQSVLVAQRNLHRLSMQV